MFIWNMANWNNALSSLLTQHETKTECKPFLWSPPLNKTAKVGVIEPALMMSCDATLVYLFVYLFFICFFFNVCSIWIFIAHWKITDRRITLHTYTTTSNITKSIKNVEIWFYRDNTVNLSLHDGLLWFADLCMPPSQHIRPWAVHMYLLI